MPTRPPGGARSCLGGPRQSCEPAGDRVTMPVGARQTGDHRVNRGGSWNSNARNVRAAYRNHDQPGDRNDNLGLRLARAQGRAGGRVPDPPRDLTVEPCEAAKSKRTPACS
ncbi:MAG: SUMF1/EgtB/PvdO family nonheme iron enzyme [Myxococcales bacterium]|nr:SUMF1/EgtB/PvdO family nonheme iron enzyme [Myxococcales bacterium]